MADCLFCRIVQKQIPATLVHEGKKSVAFRDIHPRAPVHVLVVPKDHVDNLMGLNPASTEILSDIQTTIQTVVRQEKLEEAGFRVVVNNGRDSGQEVSHLHYHILGGRRLAWPPG